MGCYLRTVDGHLSMFLKVWFYALEGNLYTRRMIAFVWSSVSYSHLWDVRLHLEWAKS